MTEHCHALVLSLSYQHVFSNRNHHALQQAPCFARCVRRLRTAEHCCIAGGHCVGLRHHVVLVLVTQAVILAMHALSMGCLCIA